MYLGNNNANSQNLMWISLVEIFLFVPVFFNLYVKPTAGLWALLRVNTSGPIDMLNIYTIKKNGQSFTQKVKPTIWPT